MWPELRRLSYRQTHQVLCVSMILDTCTGYLLGACEIEGQLASWQMEDGLDLRAICKDM